MSIVNRSILEGYFANASIPTASNFVDFIESTVNMANDGITVNEARQFGLGTSSPGAALAVQPQTTVALTGTVNVIAGSTLVTGSGTAFTSEQNDGDVIKIDGHVFSLATITNDTSLTLSANVLTTKNSVTAYRDGNFFSVSNGLDQSFLTINQSGKMGLGVPVPTEVLDVGGTVKAAGFSGDGSSLTGLTASQVSGTFSASQIPSLQRVSQKPAPDQNRLK